MFQEIQRKINFSETETRIYKWNKSNIVTSQHKNQYVDLINTKLFRYIGVRITYV